MDIYHQIRLNERQINLLIYKYTKRLNVYIERYWNYRCQKYRKILDRNIYRQNDKKSDRQKDKKSNRQKDMQKDRKTERYIEILKDIQTIERYVDCYRDILHVVSKQDRYLLEGKK